MFRKLGFHHRDPREQAESSSVAEDEISVQHARPSRRPKSVSFAPSEVNSVRISNTHRAISNASTAVDSVFPGTGKCNSPSFDDDTSDPLGLHLVCADPDPVADIIFVHGLGGTCRKTWSWDRNIENFWPPWLVEDSHPSPCRIFTFGYNSQFKGAGTNLNIIDFAKDLLFQLSTFWSRSSQYDGPIGRHRIIFVAHSMGGLVVKKAYVLGKHDSQYAKLIDQVYGIVFLATPHRGSQYAKILNNVLSAAPIGAPPKSYVADLDAHATALQDINEQFRVSCEALALVSFFETHKIGFGFKFLIVEKESAILGYPQETSAPLNGDHHTVCKFRNREDANYRKVRNTLQQWILDINQSSLVINRYGENKIRAPFQSIQTICGLISSPEEELEIVRGKVMEGTCHWILQRSDYLQWISATQKSQNPRIFWLIGLPATGKTTLSSVVIDHIQFRGKGCAYHFFSSGHQAKRAVTYCLRSIVTQLAHSSQEFRERLIAMHEESGINFTSQDQDFQVIWIKVFEAIIFKMHFPSPLFWVLDAMDEADSPHLLMSHFARIHSKTPIRIFFTSRPMRIPSLATARASFVATCFLTEADTMEDISAYVRSTLQAILPGEDKLRTDITDEILAKASGSFLWVKLALETLRENWHTEDDIRKSLTDIPEGMEDLYRQMLTSLECQPARSRFIAERILTWALCSWRPLSLVELASALEPELKDFVNLRDTLNQVCGHFITVDCSKILVIHATAREFLLDKHDEFPAFVERLSGNQHLMNVCLKFLAESAREHNSHSIEGVQSTFHGAGSGGRFLISEREHPLLSYSACYWAYHASKSTAGSQGLIDDINSFLSTHCLSWIETVALSKDLQYLTRSAQYLKTVVKRRRVHTKHDGLTVPLSLEEPSEDAELVTQRWANDIVRLVTKFGSSIIQNPSSIHRLIPAFCPTGSMVGSTFATNDPGSISVRGLSTNDWGDCLATVSIEDNSTASQVLAVHDHFVVLIRSTGTAIVWNAETCEEKRRLQHREYVSHMVANRYGDLLATAGAKMLRIWNILSGTEVSSLPVSQEAGLMAMAIKDDNAGLVVGFDDCSIREFELETSKQTWRLVVEDPRGVFHGCPSIMAFSPDLKKVAIAWRGFSPLVWILSEKDRRQPYRCKAGRSSKTGAIANPESFAWQTDGKTLLVLCQSAVIVEWHIYEDTQRYLDHIVAREMTTSLDGNLLMTSDHTGTISIWTLPRANLIYRLVNQNAFIRSLTFSSDAKRFYDTRGSLCNVWEPTVLVQAADQDDGDHSSVGESSILTEPVVTEDLSSQSQVTALAIDTEDSYYCCGKTDGTVFIHDVEDGHRLRKVYAHDTYTSIILLAWSASGRYIVSGDETGRIMAKRLEAKDTAKWAVFSVLDIRLSESVQQFLFNPDEKLLLVSTSSTDVVYDLKAKVELHREDWGIRQSRRWVEHPSTPECLMQIGIDSIDIYRWENLQHMGCTRLTENAAEEPWTLLAPSCGTHTPVPDEPNRRVVQFVTFTKDKRYMIYETLPDTGHSSSRSTSGLQLKLLSTTGTDVEHPLASTNDGMHGFVDRVKRLLGTYQGAIVFLDHDNWLCTWEICSSVDNIKRQFFLPKDWLNPSMLQVAIINEKGTFFCPKYQPQQVTGWTFTLFSLLTTLGVTIFASAGPVAQIGPLAHVSGAVQLTVIALSFTFLTGLGTAFAKLQQTGRANVYEAALFNFAISIAEHLVNYLVLAVQQCYQPDAIAQANEAIAQNAAVIPLAIGPAVMPADAAQAQQQFVAAQAQPNAVVAAGNDDCDFIGLAGLGIVK